MKKYIIILLFAALIAKAVLAQTPEPIYSFARVLKPIPYYKEQALAWQLEINKNNKNAFAWYNYYRANRCLFRLDTNDKRSSLDKSNAEKKIVDDMEKAVPESYEYNLCRWLIGGNNYEYLPYLKKAAELGPNRTEHIPDMIVRGEIERDINQRNEYAKKWYESKDASAGLLYYNFNVIATLKPNAIILTAGDNDTYPIWLLQSQGIRKDITVINLSLIYVDAYRAKVFKELGIPTLDLNYKGLKLNKKGLATDSDYQNFTMNPFHAQIIKHIAANKNKLPVYVALTTGTEYTNAVEDKLYLTGLAYEYSNEAIDNMAVLKRNFEQRFALDYLDKAFYEDVSAEVVKEINCNYIAPMFKLYEHYKAAGDLQKAQWMKDKLVYLLKGKHDEKELLNHLSEG